MAVTVLLETVRRSRVRSAGAVPARYRWCLAMYCTTPSGTRYQTGLPAADALPAVGRADRHGRHLLQVDPVGGQALVAELVPGAGDPDELGQLEQLVDVLPGQDLRQGVGAR